jgi:ABC-type branched-subunit amino acid transport system substrate-binding protein
MHRPAELKSESHSRRNVWYLKNPDRSCADEQFDIVASVTPAEMDFKPILLKLKTTPSEAIGVFLFPGQVQQFYRQAQSLQIAMPSVGTHVFDSRAEVEGAGPLINGAVFPGVKVTEPFRDKYIRTFNNDSQLPWAANAFDLAETLNSIVQKRNFQVTGQQILDLMKDPTVRSGASGDYKFVNDPTYGEGFIFPVVLKQIVNNKVHAFEGSP